MDIARAHTADLDASTLTAIKALLLDVFEDEFADDDWDHSLGGLHALGWHDGELVGHACLVQRRLIYADRVLRAGYVEAVAVRADHRRNGLATALMASLERAIRAAYDLGALSAAEEAIAFYAALGWRRWRGPTFALTPTGRVRTEDDDGGVFVLPASIELDVEQPLTCDWRDGDLW
jgi:aminoglycoside 2'-N-acetyltransferase I